MQELSTKKEHLFYIDWMKFLGMWIIILGHFFPTNLQYFTYAFSVQLFFFISGFLFHAEKNNSMFFKKNFVALYVPYLIWGGISLLCYNVFYDKFNNVLTSLGG